MKPRLLLAVAVTLTTHINAAETDWDGNKALALAKVHKDTVIECKQYAKYKVEEKLIYCEQILAQRERVHEMLVWLEADRETVPRDDIALIIEYLEETATDFRYLQEVGVFD
jgi:hypothetical protein